MKVRFLQVAEIDLDDSIRWYNAQAPGLGDAFLVEVLSAAKRIAHYPDAWQSLDEGVRRFRLSRFPYGSSTRSRTRIFWCLRSPTCTANRTIGAIG